MMPLGIVPIPIVITFLIYISYNDSKKGMDGTQFLMGKKLLDVLPPKLRPRGRSPHGENGPRTGVRCLLGSGSPPNRLPL